MSNFLSWLKRTFIRWIVYVVGAFVILAILGTGIFYAAKPYLMEVAQKKLAAYKIKSDTFNLTMPANAVLTNVILPTPDGIKATAGKLSVRPPLGPLAGSATLYNLIVEYDNVTLEIPYLSAGGIQLNSKNMSTDSKVLQNLSRVGIGSLNAPNINTTLRLPNGQTQNFSMTGFSMSGFKNGAIGSIGLNSMNGSLSLAALTNNPELDMHVTASSGAMSAHSIDIAYSYGLFSGHSTQKKSGSSIFGKVTLDKVSFDIASKDNENISLKLGSLMSNGLKLKNPSKSPESLLKNIQVAKASGNKVQEQKAVKEFILTLVKSIVAIDGEISDASINSDKISASLSSFRLAPKDWKNNLAIPQQMLVSVNGLSFDDKHITGSVKQLLEMFGLNNQNISGQMSYVYAPAKKTLTVNDLSFKIGNLATGKLSAQVVNVDEAIFSGDEIAIISLAGELGVNEIDMHYADTGLIDHIFESIGKRVQPDDVKGMKSELYDDFDLILTQSSMSLLRDPVQAQKVADTLKSFSRNPSQLHINIKSKNPKGLTFLDLTNTTGAETENQDGLALLLEKINLTVEQY